MLEKKSGIERVAFVGNYVPRQCGIATFTTDLCEASARAFKNVDYFAVPMTDQEEGYLYPNRVRFEVAQDDIGDYRRAADFLNINDVDVVCLQHEYGIFGGIWGSHIIAMLQDLRMPIVTTLHTVLKEPLPGMDRVLDDLIRLSDRIVVMNEKGMDFLQESHGLPKSKIDFIHHGIPDVPFVDPNFHKDKFGISGKIVILTFGLLGPQKGIENMIHALPSIVKKFPNVVYLIVGATSGHWLKLQGESYRLSLQRLAHENGVESNVVFHNRFVSLNELIEFIGAADIYVTPYLAEEQITSGTLAYSVGAGKAVVSTPYWYAQELLSNDRGKLVPFSNPEAIAEKVISLLKNESDRHAMRKRAFTLGRKMIWPVVAKDYMKSFRKAREGRGTKIKVSLAEMTVDQRPRELPLLKLDHLIRMTDDTGIFRNAIYSIPDYTLGYSTDNNARALILAILLEEVGKDTFANIPRISPIRYLAFLWNAFNRKTKRFRNILSFNREWVGKENTEECHARALWALATVLAYSKNEGLRGMAARLFEEAIKPLLKFTSARAWCYGLIAIQEYLKLFAGDRITRRIRQSLAEKLMAIYKTNSSNKWHWFESQLTYCNSKLPHALLLCGRWMKRDDMIDIGLSSLEWLTTIQKTKEGDFCPIGSQGYYQRGKKRAMFSQYPIEAQAMVSAAMEAQRVTHEKKWQDEANRAFEWFLGRNVLGESLYDPITGGCKDSLMADRVNHNQGGESTLAFLLSLVEMRLSQTIINPMKSNVKKVLPEGINPDEGAQIQ